MVTDCLKQTGDFIAFAVCKAIPELSRIGAVGVCSILSKNFEEHKIPITVSNFNPCTKWVESRARKAWVIDTGDGYEYLNDPGKRVKCLVLVGATLIVHAVALVLNIANRIAKFLSFAHLWYPNSNEAYNFQDRFIEWCGDLLRIALTPIIYIGLELAAIYGTIMPFDGAKLYATFERYIYASDDGLIAPCFQPSPTHHLFSGDRQVLIDGKQSLDPNAW